VVLAVLVVGGGLYLLLAYPRPGMPIEQPPTHATSSGQNASRPAPVVRSTAVPSLITGAPPDQPDAAATVSRAVSAAIRKRDLLVAAHVQQVIQEADERAFSRLEIPETQRVAIRLLNEQHTKRTRSDLAAQRDDLVPEQQFGSTIAITENGLANDDKPASDGKVHDPERTAFLDAYLTSLRRASGEGVPLKGYFHWSLLDNFEWTQGFSQRFGLIYVDYKTQKRILKDSAARYTQIIRSQGAIL